MTALLLGAFAAGMVATVNPCGFAMLPAYLGMFIGDEGPNRRPPLVVGVLVSLGFVAVFGIAGLLVASGIRAIIGWIPWIALAIGVGLVAVGVAELRGTHIFSRLPGVSRAPRSRSAPGLVAFGASYGLASLSCTLPIFLSLIAGAVATSSLTESLFVFGAYGAGMSLVVIVLTLAMAVGRDRVLRTIRPISAHLGTISGWVLIVAGAFIVWYWATVLASGAIVFGHNLVVQAIERIAAGAAGAVAANPVVAALVLASLGLGAAWLVHRSQIAAQERDEEEDVTEVPGEVSGRS